MISAGKFKKSKELVKELTEYTISSPRRRLESKVTTQAISGKNVLEIKPTLAFTQSLNTDHNTNLTPSEVNRNRITFEGLKKVVAGRTISPMNYQDILTEARKIVFGSDFTGINSQKNKTTNNFFYKTPDKGNHKFTFSEFQDNKISKLLEKQEYSFQNNASQHHVSRFAELI